MTDIEIVYRDEYLVAINKPAGLLVHRSELDKHETNFAVQSVRDIVGSYVYPVHRLDKPTSGVLLFGLNPEITASMCELFLNREIEKRYIAMVRGYTPESGTIDHPLRKIIDHYGKPAYKSDEEQEAVTKFRSLATVELPVQIDRYPSSRYSLVELTPKTGRRHQLRRHMKHLSHPIIGDPKYGKSRHNNYFKDSFDTQRLLLASTKLSFIHPKTRNTINIKSLPSDSFIEIFKLFNFNYSEYLKKL